MEVLKTFDDKLSYNEINSDYIFFFNKVYDQTHIKKKS